MLSNRCSIIMKSFLKYTGFLTILCLWTACKDSGSPKSIATLFLISMNKNDMVTARNISTRNTQDILKIWEKLTKDKFTEAELNRRAENFKVEVYRVKQTSDTIAWVQFKTRPQILPFEEIRLLKFTDKSGRERWRVDISTLALLESDSSMNATSSDDGQLHPEPDSTAAPE